MKLVAAPLVAIGMVVSLVFVVVMGAAFVPGPIGGAAALASAGGPNVAVLRADLAEAKSYAAQLAAAESEPATAAEAAGASLVTQLDAWQPARAFAAVETDLREAAAALAKNGAAPATLSARLGADLAAVSTTISALSSRYDVVSLVALAEQVGFTGNGAATAAAVAMAESSGDPVATDHDPNGTVDYGLWQINWPTHAGVVGTTAATQLYTPLVNAKAAFAVSNGGADWRPWTTYQRGAEIPYLAAAETAVKTGA